MSDEKPYSETFYAESARLYEAQSNAAQRYTSQMLYMQHKMFSRDDAIRQQEADKAAEDWLRLDAEITALNAAEYGKRAVS